MFFLNNKIYTFHDLFTELTDKQHALSTEYNKLLYVCGGRGIL